MPSDENTALVVRALSLLIRQKTFAGGDRAPFLRMNTLLSELFPLVFSKSEIQVGPDCALLLCLKGGQGAQPLLFLSHMDVVPAHFEDAWEAPPFGGVVKDGWIWGRGALDMKGHLCALLTAAESLLREGWTPKGDVYFAFSTDEETRGGSMCGLRDLLRAQGVTPAFVLDEGGFVTQLTSRHKEPAALVGVAEKGHLRFTVRAQADIGAERLLRAGVKLSRLRFPARMTPTVEQTLTALSGDAKHGLKAFTRHLTARVGRRGALNLLAASREDKTMVSSHLELQRLSGDALYFDPPTLTYCASLLHGDSAQGLIERIKALLKKEKVLIEIKLIEEPSLISPAHGAAWEALETAINVHFPRIPVVPYLLAGGSDARHMQLISPNVYRFSPFIVSREELRLIHHNNERISIDNLTRGVQFFKQILQA